MFFSWKTYHFHLPFPNYFRHILQLNCHTDVNATSLLNTFEQVYLGLVKKKKDSREPVVVLSKRLESAKIRKIAINFDKRRLFLCPHGLAAMHPIWMDPFEKGGRYTSNRNSSKFKSNLESNFWNSFFKNKSKILKKYKSNINCHCAVKNVVLFNI